MKKKLLIAALLLGVLFSGCGNSGDTSATNPTEDDAEYEEADYADDSYEEEPEEVIVAAYPFTKLRPFSEERAWINFDEDGITCTGLIDTSGRLLYQAEREFLCVSPFQDGLSFYIENSSETSPCGIVDLDGNVLFESQITPDGGYLILAYGNSSFRSGK